MLRRLLLFIPTFMVITLISFILLVNAPGDPVERMMTASQSSGDNTQSVVQQEQRAYWTHRLGLDLPVFYFSIHSLAEPDTLYRIPNKAERNTLSQFIREYGNEKEILRFYAAESALEKKVDGLACLAADDTVTVCDHFNSDRVAMRMEWSKLKSTTNPESIRLIIQNTKTFFLKYDFLGKEISVVENLENNFEDILRHPQTWKNYIPCISFHANNQYHRWLFGDGQSNGLLRGDFGISYLTKQPVEEMIRGKIGWSLFFTLVSVFFAYLLSIPLGIKAAAKKDSRFDRISSMILFMLYSLPVFWVATLLLMTFSNTDAFHIFPASGIKPVTGYPVDAGLIDKIKLSLPYLILPTICYTYSSLAFLSRTMRVSMLEILSQDFIRTARAKGLPEHSVLWKHALRNSLLPVITVFANVFPYMIGGSVILESIFTIPGMGSQIYNSIDAQDFPMIVAVFTLTGMLTMLGYLVSDVLYAWADPRISFSENTSAA
ncbi:MAG: ABC transporter permease [Bacteroidetes bacterium]|nr:ABC transporter permease [Bacteroidota bacterium]